MRFLVHTYGCQMNVRDSDAATALLEAAGHKRAANEAEADLIIVNTCSVRGKAEDKAIGKLGMLCATKREHPARLVGVMGCMAQRLGESLFTKIPTLDFAVGTRRCGAIPMLVARAQAGEKRVMDISPPDEIPDVPDTHSDAESSCSAFVTILLGCNRRCTYCIVPDVRGPEFSRPAREIIAEITALARHEVKEVTLLGQSVMRYGITNPVWFEDDLPSPANFTEPLPRLLEAVAAIPGIARIRFTSGHPGGCTDQLVRAMRDLPAVAPHLHLPVQSGSDEVLKRMRRGYTRADYLDAVTRLRQAMPDFTLTTDVIVGFPGETTDQFEETRSLLEEAGADNAFIFKYSPRPGTPAAEWEDDIPDEEKARRNQVLLADQDIRGLEANQRLVNTLQQVLVEGPSLRNPKRWSGRSPGNRIVIFEPTTTLKQGELVMVKINRAAPQTLYGTLI